MRRYVFGAALLVLLGRAQVTRLLVQRGKASADTRVKASRSL